jgi:hypothetical protein
VTDEDDLPQASRPQRFAYAASACGMRKWVTFRDRIGHKLQNKQTACSTAQSYKAQHAVMNAEICTPRQSHHSFRERSE